MVRPASMSAVAISPSEWFHWWLRGLEDHDSQKLTILRFLGSKTPGQIFGSLTFTNLCRFAAGTEGSSISTSPCGRRSRLRARGPSPIIHSGFNEPPEHIVGRDPLGCGHSPRGAEHAIGHGDSKRNASFGVCDIAQVAWLGIFHEIGGVGVVVIGT